ncbi:MAG: tyrosine-type recombinase/integrase [Flavobacteriia bacterium]|nr:tyrosine-type recombinase/integrase [Flavobacteriia bacterium]
MGKPSNIVVHNKYFQSIANRYYQHVQQLGYASSREKYLSLNIFLSWLEQQGIEKIETVTTSHVAEYYQFIRSRTNQRTGKLHDLKTCHAHMVNVRDVFTLLQSDGDIEQNVCNTLKFPSPKPSSKRTALTQDEINALYEVALTGWERVILSLAYGCGLRVSEVVKCNTEDIRLRDKLLIVRKGKGNKRRTVPLSSGVVKDLEHYFFYDRVELSKGADYKQGEKAFLLHSRGGRMHPDTCNKYLKRMIFRTENSVLIEKNISMHHLRHSIATHLLEKGMPVEQVRNFLGHKHLQTTQLYTHIGAKQLEKLIL